MATREKENWFDLPLGVAIAVTSQEFVSTGSPINFFFWGGGGGGVPTSQLIS